LAPAHTGQITRAGNPTPGGGVETADAAGGGPPGAGRVTPPIGGGGVPGTLGGRGDGAPRGSAGLAIGAGVGADRRVPQLRQKMAPCGLSRPQLEQRVIDGLSTSTVR
jgi:hypothetical protein